MSRDVAFCLAMVIAWRALPGAAQTGESTGKGGTLTGTVLARRYKERETLAYHMSATNQGRVSTIRYEADARGVVTKNAAGRFLEAFEWSGLKLNGEAVTLPAGNGSFQQNLSLDPEVPPTMPDFSRVDPRLIGPCADLLTFYADLWLVLRTGTLAKAGDHLYVKNGTPNSWADGHTTLLGQDSIDFDITLGEVNARAGTATVIVRHLPPAEPQIKMPTQWMQEPVADTSNNWVEVSKTGSEDHPYLGEVGKETFEVKITVSLADGKILSATMDNPVEAIARECEDAELTKCGKAERYRIRRQIEVRLGQ